VTSANGSSSKPVISTQPLSPNEILAKDQVALAHAAHTELSALWKEKGDVIITRWKEIAIPTLRTAMLQPILKSIPEGTEYAEVTIVYLSNLRRAMFDEDYRGHSLVFLD
jgi:hypothetical protein